MSFGNGLTLEDLLIEQADLDVYVKLYDSIELNQLTHEEVLALFRKTTNAFNPEKKQQVKMMLGRLAAFIYVNGIHESLRDTLRVDDETTWGTLKAFWDFKASKKQLMVRWVASINATAAQAEVKPARSITFRHATRYSLMDLYEAIPKMYRFFGAQFTPNISFEDSQKVLAFQNAVIRNSQGGSIEAQPVSFKRART